MVWRAYVDLRERVGTVQSPNTRPLETYRGFTSRERNANRGLWLGRRPVRLVGEALATLRRLHQRRRTHARRPKRPNPLRFRWGSREDASGFRTTDSFPVTLINRPNRTRSEAEIPSLSEKRQIRETCRARHRSALRGRSRSRRRRCSWSRRSPPRARPCAAPPPARASPSRYSVTVENFR